jgi:hydrogenase-4 component E
LRPLPPEGASATQLINLFAALLLLLSFGLLAQRRVLSLIHLFTLQGITLTASTTAMAFFTGQPHLYWSAASRCC